MGRRYAAIGLLLSLGACAVGPRPSPMLSGVRYVAMGSSFAAGPGITEPADTPPNRCSRSMDNYAHQLARAKGLLLVDVSCGGATTAHILGPWNELPAQIDALTPDTRLVTVTIGGNDVDYIKGLFAGSCAKPSTCPTAALQPPNEAAWMAVESGLIRIAQEVRRRVPAARLIFVDYPVILPPRGSCAATPLTPDAAATARTTAQRLAALTAKVARQSGAGLIRASQLSVGHDACAKIPWMGGFSASPGQQRYAPYHPNKDGMTAIATALARLLDR